VKAWLKALLAPYISEAYRIMRIQHGLPAPPCVLTTLEPTTLAPVTSEVPPLMGSTVGHLALFNQYLQQKGLVVEWRYHAEDGEGSQTTPMWLVQAFLDDRCLAIGRGNKKKIARNEAAKKGLDELGVTIEHAGDMMLQA